MSFLFGRWPPGPFQKEAVGPEASERANRTKPSLPIQSQSWGHSTGDPQLQRGPGRRPLLLVSASLHSPSGPAHKTGTIKLCSVALWKETGLKWWVGLRAVVVPHDMEPRATEPFVPLGVPTSWPWIGQSGQSSAGPAADHRPSRGTSWPAGSRRLRPALEPQEALVGGSAAPPSVPQQRSRGKVAAALYPCLAPPTG